MPDHFGSLCVDWDCILGDYVTIGFRKISTFLGCFKAPGTPTRSNDLEMTLYHVKDHNKPLWDDFGRF